jgi:hypothetical protein
LQGEEFAEIGAPPQPLAPVLVIEAALVERHLQFFIETVSEFGLDALDVGENQSYPWG